MLSLLLYAGALIPLINIGHCFWTDNDVKQNQDAYQGLTERELILTLVKRIDNLEEWNQKQQKEITYLKAANRKQERKLTILERILEHLHRPLTSMDSNESTSSNNYNVSSTQYRPNEHHLQKNAKATIVKKGQPEKHIHVVRRQVHVGKQVAFYATLSQHKLGLMTYENIVFDNATTNIGHAYNPNTGIFTAPFSGTYVISATLMAHSRADEAFYLAVDSFRLSWIYTRGLDSPLTTSSQTFVLQLRKDTTIEIRSRDNGSNVHGDASSSLSGFLLYLENDASAVVG